MSKLLNSQSLNTDFATFILRLSFGALFMYHGFMKIASFNSMAGHFPNPIKVGSTVSLLLVIFAEFFCGFFVAIGLMTRLAVIPILITMVVAYFMVHGAQEFKVKELALVYMILSLVVFVLGSGKASVDKLILKK
jgi:putative oxidoreductase